MAGQRARARERHQARRDHGRGRGDHAPPTSARHRGGDDGAPLNLRQVRDEAEKDAVLRVLGRVNGNLSKAAELLGVSRPTLYDLMHRFGLR